MSHKGNFLSNVQFNTEVIKHIVASCLILEFNVFQREISLNSCLNQLGSLSDLFLILVLWIKNFKKWSCSIFTWSHIGQKVSVVPYCHCRESDRINCSEYVSNSKLWVISYENGSNVENKCKYHKHDDLRKSEQESWTVSFFNSQIKGLPQFLLVLVENYIFISKRRHRSDVHHWLHD